MNEGVEANLVEILENGPEEVGQLLTQLDALGIGKTIVRKVQKHNVESRDQARMGVDLPSDTEYLRLGHILPCDEDERSHIIITTDGEIAYVNSDHPDAPNFNQSAYYRYLSSVGDHAVSEWYAPRDHRNILSTVSFNCGTLGASFLNSSDPKNTEFVIGKFRIALALGAKQRDAILEARKTTRQAVTKGLKDLLTGGPPAGEQK